MTNINHHPTTFQRPAENMKQFGSDHTEGMASIFIDTDSTNLLNERPWKLPSSLMFRQESGEEEEPVRDFKKKRQSMNKKKRVVLKEGLTNVAYKNISNKRRRYFSDLYTTLLDSSWGYCVILFSASFYGSWLLFGILYYCIAYIHGDLDDGHLPSDDSDWVPCIMEIDGFSASFLFSLETQHTIGYGGRQTTTQCGAAIIAVSVQVRKHLLDSFSDSFSSPGSAWMSHSGFHGWSCIF